MANHRAVLHRRQVAGRMIREQTLNPRVYALVKEDAHSMS